MLVGSRARAPCEPRARRPRPARRRRFSTARPMARQRTLARGRRRVRWIQRRESGPDCLLAVPPAPRVGPRGRSRWSSIGVRTIRMACPFVHLPLARLRTRARPREAARRIRLDEIYPVVSPARRSLKPLERKARRTVLLGYEQLGLPPFITPLPLYLC